MAAIGFNNCYEVTNMAELYAHTPVLKDNHPADPGDNVKTFFITRMLISLSLIAAGLIVLSLGYHMLIESTAIPNKTSLLNIASGLFQVTLEGFSAFIMLISVVPFAYAYKALPERRRSPLPPAQHIKEQPQRRDYRSKNAS